MEELRVSLNKVEMFDTAVHGKGAVPSIPHGDDLQIITKDNGTSEGRAIACLTFTVEVDGKLMRAQAVTTVRLLTSALAVLKGRYGDEGGVADMTEEEQTLLLIRGTIAGMPEDDRIRVESVAETFRNALKAGGLHAAMAFALVGAEQGAKP